MQTDEQTRTDTQTQSWSHKPSFVFPTQRKLYKSNGKVMKLWDISQTHLKILNTNNTYMRKQYTGVDNVYFWKGRKYTYLYDFHCCVNIYVQNIVTQRERQLRIITGAVCNAVINLETANGKIDVFECKS
jgi:hypothetical protein